MTVPTVDNFLCVIDLNLGGLIIGYFIAIIYGLYALLLVYDLFFSSLFTSEKVQEITKKIVTNSEQFSPGVELIEGVVIANPTEETGKTLATEIVEVIVIFLLVTCCFLTYWFTRGIKERNTRKIKPFLILIAFFTGATFLHGVTSFSARWVVTGMIHVYLLIVVYSIYQQIAMENCPVQQELHNAAPSQGYTKAYGSEAGNDSNGYQASEFKGP